MDATFVLLNVAFFCNVFDGNHFKENIYMELKKSFVIYICGIIVFLM
jgi:flagellar motor switch protein FliM